MPDVFFDEDEATRLLDAVVDQTRAQSDAHRGDRPNFPASSAGRDFGGHGAQIQALLSQLHERSVAVGQHIGHSGCCTRTAACLRGDRPWSFWPAW